MILCFYPKKRHSYVFTISHQILVHIKLYRNLYYYLFFYCTLCRLIQCVWAGFPPHLLCLRKRSYSHMLMTGETERETEKERDQDQEGAGMRQDCFGFGAMAAVSDVRWEDVIIWPWRTTMVSYHLPHCNNSGGPHACKGIFVNTPARTHPVFSCICTESLLRQDSRQQRKQQQRQLNMREGKKQRD